ncbi:CPBP family intramembrane glutamic endopeptidase [Roseateles oligotrophus]|uniref:CPBP family intramembrane metalloprotease n=1 Tax=Roseateles oligotrophus TaxID=1769250 RepID=A0ABT2YCY4_9BURK|nr:CPBP family intramembrane glutamic endopeptidase [Roseateles oligotrophus]MCV2367884.1 CPBP family intramembrane metalloprotease [Roseateles oligotrophus]
MRHFCTQGLQYFNRYIALVVAALLLYMAMRLLLPLLPNGHLTEFLLCTNSRLTEWDQKVPATILGLLIAVLVSPIIEEYIFRKCLLTALVRKMHWAYAAFISSMLFTAGHSQYIINYFDPGNLLAVWIAGMVYAIIYLKRNSLLDSFLSHASLNIFILIPKEEIFGIHCASIKPLMAFAFAMVLLAGLAILLWKIPKYPSLIPSRKLAAHISKKSAAQQKP